MKYGSIGVAGVYENTGYSKSMTTITITQSPKSVSYFDEKEEVAISLSLYISDHLFPLLDEKDPLEKQDKIFETIEEVKKLIKKLLPHVDVDQFIQENEKYADEELISKQIAEESAENFVQTHLIKAQEANSLLVNDFEAFRIINADRPKTFDSLNDQLSLLKAKIQRIEKILMDAGEDGLAQLEKVETVQTQHQQLLKECHEFIYTLL